MNWLLLNNINSNGRFLLNLPAILTLCAVVALLHGFGKLRKKEVTVQYKKPEAKKVTKEAEPVSIEEWADVWDN